MFWIWFSFVVYISVNRTILKVYAILLSICKILLWGKFFSAHKLMTLLPISVVGERHKSMWASTLRYSDRRWSCTSSTSHISPLTSDNLRSYDVSPQWQLITANGPEVTLYLTILGTLEKRFDGYSKLEMLGRPL